LGDAVSVPAWKSKPSWYLVAKDDKMIPPPAQHQMAQRAGASIAEVGGSHAVYVSQPQAVADVIKKATQSLKQATLDELKGAPELGAPLFQGTWGFPVSTNGRDCADVLPGTNAACPRPRSPAFRRPEGNQESQSFEQPVTDTHGRCWRSVAATRVVATIYAQIEE